jgi:hypothetical protein
VDLSARTAFPFFIKFDLFIITYDNSTRMTDMSFQTSDNNLNRINLNAFDFGSQHNVRHGDRMCGPLVHAVEDRHQNP